MLFRYMKVSTKIELEVRDKWGKERGRLPWDHT